MADLDVTRWLDKIGVRPLMLMASVIAGIALGVQAWLWVNSSDYQPLYTGLTDRDASKVADSLTAAGIPMKFSDAGGIEVPSGRVREARMKMASESLPMGSAVGMEMLHQEQNFGTSQFIESARYQTALETELARTVTSMQSVKVARVHLAMAKESAFARDHREGSASVLIELYPGRRLEMAQVDAIVHLVSGSVPNLSAGRVTVVDQAGHLLSENNRDPMMQANAVQFEQRQALETSLTQRIEQLLTPMIGAGRVSAQVSADMDFSVTEEARESYNPEPRAIRSEKITEKSSQGAGGAPGGIPGATANKPDTAASARNAAGGSGNVKNINRDESRSYEIDRTISHTKSPSSQLERLSIAVLIDNIPTRNSEGKIEDVPLTEAQLKQVDALVKQAVGFNAERGDTLAITNQPFLRPEIEPLPDAPIWEAPWLQSAGKQLLGILVLLVIGFGVVRPAMKNMLQTQSVLIRNRAAEAVPGDVAGIPGQPALAGATPMGGSPGVLGYDEKLSVARGAVAQDPKQVAQVVKAWVSNDG